MRTVRCGIVGFGFAGPLHAEAMMRLGFVDIAGICSPRIELAEEKATQLGLSSPTFYRRYEDLVADPAIDVVDIVTPTRMHYAVAMAAIARGKHVIVDKPLAATLEEAREMTTSARTAGVVNAVTFNYRYYPLIQHARSLVKSGEVGEIHLIHGRYLQEWLLYDTDFSWRLDPQESGPAAMIGDAGCHWFDLVEYVTGLQVTSVLADLRTVIPVRRKPLESRNAFAAKSVSQTEPYSVRVPDLGAILVRFSNGAVGTFVSSPVCAGHKNDLRFEVHGANLSLSWVQEEPNQLWIGRRGQPDQVLVRDPGLLASGARPYASMPGGHTEGWPDAFKNILRNIFALIAENGNSRARNGNAGSKDGIEFPTFEDGSHAAAISDALVRSGQNGGVWTNVER